MNPGERITAYCGIVCSDCSAYLATRAGDAAALERVAGSWEEQYGLENVTVTDVTCDGCTAPGRKGSHCAVCDIRACGQAQAVETCAHCEYYPCDKLERFFSYAPTLRASLDAIKASLQP